MGRYFRALWYLVTGRFKKAADALSENKYVMEATYDRSIEKNTGRIQTVKTNVASLIRLNEENKEKLGAKMKAQEHQAKVKAGALQMAKDRAAALQAQGKTPDQIKADAEYIKCQAGYAAADKEWKRLDGEIDEIEAKIAEREGQINQYKVELQNMQRNIDNLKEEKHEAIADVAVAQQERDIADALNGLSSDTTDQDLQAVREARKRVKAEAKVSKELAGTNARNVDNEFANYAEKAGANDEFASLIGLEQKAAPTPDAPSKLPEN
jgi:phage shock protein A